MGKVLVVQATVGNATMWVMLIQVVCVFNRAAAVTTVFLPVVRSFPVVVEALLRVVAGRITARGVSGYRLLLSSK